MVVCSKYITSIQIFTYSLGEKPRIKAAPVPGLTYCLYAASKGSAPAFLRRKLHGSVSLL